MVSDACRRAIESATGAPFHFVRVGFACPSCGVRCEVLDLVPIGERISGPSPCMSCVCEDIRWRGGK